MNFVRVGVVTSATALGCLASPVGATSILGSSSAFAVLGGSTVTNTGPSTIYGDLGVMPGSAITGQASITLNGSIDDADEDAALAQSNARAAWTSLSTLPATDLSGKVLGDLGTLGTLTPGAYRFSSSAQLDGALTLDFGALHNQSFIFEVGSTLTTAGGSSILTENGDAGSSIFWEVGSSATLGTGTTFAGNLIADQSITLTTGASILCGRAIALGGAVSLDTNVVSNSCSGGGNVGTGRTDYGSGGFSGGNVLAPAVPEPTAWVLMLAGFALTGVARRRHRNATGVLGRAKTGTQL